MGWFINRRHLLWRCSLGVVWGSAFSSASLQKSSSFLPKLIYFHLSSTQGRRGNGGGGRFQFEPSQKVTLGRWSSVHAFSGFLKTTQAFGSKMKPRPNANRVIKRTQTSCLGNHSTRISQGWSVPKSRTNRHVYILRGMVERWRLETLDHQLAMSVRELILPYWEISSKPKS